MRMRMRWRDWRMSRGWMTKIRKKMRRMRR
jgi:hypothetical protein